MDESAARNTPDRNAEAGSQDPAREEDRRLEAILRKGREGDTEACMEGLREFVRQFPEHAVAWGHLGYALYLSERPAEALECYRKVTELSPDNLEAWKWIGDCHYLLGRYRAARTAYRRVRHSEFESQEIEERMATVGGILRRIRQGDVGVLPLLGKRILDGGFWLGLAREAGRLPSSIPAIRNAGIPRFAGYLALHYLRDAHYRYPASPCDLCGSDDLIPVFFVEGRKIVKCRRCGLECVERKPPEGMDVAVDAYNSDELISHFEELWSDPRLLHGRMKHLEKVFAEVGVSFPRSGWRAFEIGCGDGFLLKHLAGRGLEVSGIETAERLVRACREKAGLDVEQCTIRQLDRREEHYDLVLAYHVAEHLDAPSELFEKAHAVLRPGGYLFVEVPVPDLTKLPLLYRLHEQLGYGSRYHMHFLQSETVRRYFEKYGFEVVASFEYPAEPFLPSGGFLGRRK